MQTIIEAFVRIGEGEEADTFLVHMDTKGEVINMMRVLKNIPDSWVACTKESVLAFVQSQQRIALRGK